MQKRSMDIFFVKGHCFRSSWILKRPGVALKYLNTLKSKFVINSPLLAFLKLDFEFIYGDVPYANTAKYLGMTLDAKLWWKEHIKKKCDELNIKFRKKYWLLGRNSELSVHNKLTLYKQVIHPVWSYGIQLWGCASESNIQVIQCYQNKILKCIVNAPWYV
jgi:hypothetical protein